MNAVKPKSRSQIGYLVAKTGFSLLLAITAHPHGVWRFGAAFAILAFASVCLRVGWFVPFTIAGVYFGMFVLDPPVKGGTIESQMNETVGRIVFGSAIGFIIGAAIDMAGRKDRGLETASPTVMADVPTDEREAGLAWYHQLPAAMSETFACPTRHGDVSIDTRCSSIDGYWTVPTTFPGVMDNCAERNYPGF